MAHTAKENAGFFKVQIGLWFLLTPLFSFVDVVPDFIGCLFIMSGLSPLLFVDARAQDLRGKVRTIALLSVVRTLLTPILFWSASSADDGNTNLLLSFGFCVVSILVELPLVKGLGELYTYLSVRHNSTESIRHLDGAFSILSVFFVAKNICSTLPDFLTLFSPNSLLEYNPGSAHAAASFAFAKLLLYVLCFVGIAVFGLFCAFRSARYFRCAKREEPFVHSIVMCATTQEDGNRGLRLRFVLSGSLSLLALMALFSFDYYLDYTSVLPSFVVFVLALMLFLRLKIYRKPRVYEYVACAVGFLVSAGAYFYRVLFSEDVFFSVIFHQQPWTVTFGIAQAATVFLVFVMAAFAVTQATMQAAEINLAPARNAAIVFSLVNACMNAYHYILPKTSAVTEISEGLSFFALVAGIVFCLFTWRMESVFRKTAEWKSF